MVGTQLLPWWWWWWSEIVERVACGGLWVAGRPRSCRKPSLCISFECPRTNTHTPRSTSRIHWWTSACRTIGVWPARNSIASTLLLGKRNSSVPHSFLSVSPCRDRWWEPLVEVELLPFSFRLGSLSTLAGTATRTSVEKIGGFVKIPRMGGFIDFGCRNGSTSSGLYVLSKHLISFDIIWSSIFFLVVNICNMTHSHVFQWRTRMNHWSVGGDAETLPENHLRTYFEKCQELLKAPTHSFDWKTCHIAVSAKYKDINQEMAPCNVFCNVIGGSM